LTTTPGKSGDLEEHDGRYNHQGKIYGRLLNGIVEAGVPVGALIHSLRTARHPEDLKSSLD